MDTETPHTATTQTQYQTPAQTTNSQSHEVEGTIVVVAKCPIAGSSKTRLSSSSYNSVTKEHRIPLHVCHLLAKAMVCDVVQQLTACPYLRNVRKMIVYAPGTKDGEEIMLKLVKECLGGDDDDDENNCGNGSWKDWILVPMEKSTTKEEMLSSDLGERLADALDCARSGMGSGCGVVFLGMDSPEIPTSEVARALYHAKSGCAFLCPADDGGYGMLGVPPRIDGKKVFQGVRWSSELTAVSQIKALTDNAIKNRWNSTLKRILQNGKFKDLNNSEKGGDVSEPAKKAKKLVVKKSNSIATIEKMSTPKQKITKKSDDVKDISSKNPIIKNELASETLDARHWRASYH
eukprot:CAMPEP_0116053186 /NCGR_PEP_ID=MMETSP0322-20121206/2031_1 /TAXON_ID=163516 /ORGANISM="Leptocylindrus danicus var. apora, Strain B651" /LENGTH=347 /DNA_ID=CAMNT_0003536289 /DNA_START=1 /DNA_END=1044 /DNA_ORIENTATION=-